jgi:hypothetical protein
MDGSKTAVSFIVRRCRTAPLLATLRENRATDCGTGAGQCIGADRDRGTILQKLLSDLLGSGHWRRHVVGQLPHVGSFEVAEVKPRRGYLRRIAVSPEY